MENKKYKEIMDRCTVNLEDTGIPYKYLRKLKEHEIETIGDVMLAGREGLMELKNIGWTTIYKVNKKLKKYGFTIFEDD
jgi:DNA-directed RNA polymerase alpha subunit